MACRVALLDTHVAAMEVHFWEAKQQMGADVVAILQRISQQQVSVGGGRCHHVGGRPPAAQRHTVCLWHVGRADLGTGSACGGTVCCY
jgi:hypothetical protein